MLNEFVPVNIFEVDLFLFFILVLTRVSGLFVAMPILGSRNVPIQVKIGLSAFISIILVSIMPAPPTELPRTLGAFLTVGTIELLIGIGMGFVVTLMFSAVQIAGEIMDLQTGFGMMNIFNPAMETQFPIFGFYLFILWAMFFLWMNGHLAVIQILGDSYNKLPVGAVLAIRENFGWEMARLGRYMFEFGIRLSGPVIVTMILTYAVLGVLGRAVPQIHLLVIGFPITIGLGLIVIGISLGVYIGVFEEMSYEMVREIRLFLRGIG